MNVLDYELFSDIPHYAADLYKDVKNVDVLDIAYEMFEGRIIFRIGENDYSTWWSYVSLVDFANGMLRILDAIESGRLDIFEFTHTDDCIFFEKEEGGKIRVSANYAKGDSVIDIKEFRSLVKSFSDKLMAEVLGKYPELAQNPDFREWYPDKSVFHRFT